MNLYPISVNLEARRCLVVGGGRVAERKIKTLLRHGAKVRLISPEATPTLQRRAQNAEIEWKQARYEAGGTDDLNGVFLVMACTDNKTVNAKVMCDAQNRNLLMLCADDPDAGNFVSPAQITRGELVLTVSTNGASPTLAAVLRERLEAEFGPEWAELVEIIGRQREFVKTNPDEAERKAAVRRVLDDAETRRLLLDYNLLEAESRIRECLFLSSE